MREFRHCPPASFGVCSQRPLFSLKFRKAKRRFNSRTSRPGEDGRPETTERSQAQRKAKTRATFCAPEILAPAACRYPTLVPAIHCAVTARQVRIAR